MFYSTKKTIITIRNYEYNTDGTVKSEKVTTTEAEDVKNDGDKDKKLDLDKNRSRLIKNAQKIETAVDDIFKMMWEFEKDTD